MKSSARIGDHPLHPMLIVIPAGAFILAFLCDVVYLLGGADVWFEATWPILAIGVVGALVAAVPGLIDLVTVAPHQNAAGIAIVHMLGNLVTLALFAWNAWLRWDATAPPDGVWLGFWLSLAGVALLAVSGWLGWKMVYEYHMGVLEHPEAKDPDPYRRMPGPGVEREWQEPPPREPPPPV